DKAYSVLPTDKDMDGDTITPKITDNLIELNLSETPQFVVVSGTSTASVDHSTGKLEMNVYPNPADKEVQISLTVPKREKVNLSVYTSDGKLLKTMVNGLTEQGTHHYQFGSGQTPGTYVLSLNTGSEKIVRKVILRE
ncbi:MAG TPA: T9SS type A sorting domain-containing protein, partial [Prolixibacteraceae bacterium]|nr:T9SS type A sorting domain-containing protein [Prolixibacteraceae bacterium]